MKKQMRFLRFPSITKVPCLLLCALCVLCGKLPAADDPFKKLANNLAAESPAGPVNTTVVLFPNRFSRNTLIPANKAIDIPGTHKSGFEIEIGPPYGSDVVEVIACTQPSALHKALSKYASENDAPAPFQVLTRGMAVKSIDSALASAKVGSTAALLWSQDSIVISTFPKQ